MSRQTHNVNTQIRAIHTILFILTIFYKFSLFNLDKQSQMGFRCTYTHGLKFKIYAQITIIIHQHVHFQLHGLLNSSPVSHVSISKEHQAWMSGNTFRYIYTLSNVRCIESKKKYISPYLLMHVNCLLIYNDKFISNVQNKPHDIDTFTPKAFIQKDATLIKLNKNNV